MRLFDRESLWHPDYGHSRPPHTLDLGISGDVHVPFDRVSRPRGAFILSLCSVSFSDAINNCSIPA